MEQRTQLDRVGVGPNITWLSRRTQKRLSCGDNRARDPPDLHAASVGDTLLRDAESVRIRARRRRVGVT